MATNFPSGLDSFTNPSATDSMDSVSVPHASQHANLNDAVEALEAKVGVDGSADTDSLDYKVANFTNKLGSGSGNTYPWAAGEVLHAADLNAAFDNTLVHLGTNAAGAGGYPSQCTSSGAWMINPTVSVTTSGEPLLVTFSASWVNTVTNVLVFYAYDDATTATYQILAGRYNSGNNNASGFVVFTPTGGTRNIGLHFASSTGTMQAFGSENTASLTVWAIK